MNLIRVIVVIICAKEKKKKSETPATDYPEREEEKNMKMAKLAKGPVTSNLKFGVFRLLALDTVDN